MSVIQKRIGYTQKDVLPIQDAMKLVAQWVSDDRQIKVVYHSGKKIDADIETGVIRIPRLGHLDYETLMLLRTWTCHESGHILDSKAVAKRDHPKGALFSIWNCVEDVRMEASVAEKKGVGVKSCFDWATLYYNRKLGEKFSNLHKEFITEALSAMMMRAQYQVPAWTLSDKAQEYVDLCWGEFSNVKDAKNSLDALIIAMKIYELIKEKKQEEKKQEEKKQENKESQEGDSGESSPQEGDTETQEGGSPSIDDEMDNETDDEKSQDEGLSGDPEDESDDGAKPESSDDDDDSKEPSNPSDCVSGDPEDNDSADAQMAKEIEEEIENETSEMDKSDSLAEDLNQVFDEYPDDMYTAYTDEDVYDFVTSTDDNRIKFCEVRDKISSAVYGLQRAFEQSLRILTRKRKRSYLVRGDLDKTRLVAISKSLSKNVFCDVTRKMDIDVAVALVIDESGSMIDKMEQTRNLVIALGECFSTMGIPFEIVGSTTVGRVNNYSAKRAGFSRYNPIHFRIYKQFNESWVNPEVRSRVVRINGRLNNIDGEAVELAVRRVGVRKETRKIVFSICDGLPMSGQGNDDVMARNIMDVCDAARKKNIEVFSMGIGTNSPMKYYGKDYFVKIDDVENIGGEFFMLLSRLIIGSRR